MTLEILEAYHKLKETIRKQDDIIIAQGVELRALRKDLKNSYTAEQLKPMFSIYDKDSIWVLEEHREKLFNILYKSEEDTNDTI